MAEVTRAEFNALVARVTALDHHVEPTPDPTPDPTPGITLSRLTVEAVATNFALSGTATASAGVTVKHLQIAVRGPGAKDLAFNNDKVLQAGVPVKVAARTEGQPGIFTAYLAYSLDGTTWTNGPVTTFTLVAGKDPVRPAPGDRAIPLVGRSRLGFNSIVFRQTPNDAEAFGARRGVPVDGFLLFAGRQKWDDFRWGYDRGYREWVNAGRLIVMSMPHAPESEGSQMNQRGADNAYQAQQRALGKFLLDQGMNVPNFTIRVDWECNGNWYNWSADRPGGAPALRQAITNYVTNVRAGGLTKCTFDLCFNKGPSQSGADFSIFPGAEFIDTVGIDQYDMWAPSYNEADWAREMRKPPSVAAVDDFAKSKGIMWSWDEGGNTHGSANQGGDNPVYWQMVRKMLDERSERCAWHCTYDDPGAPASLRHDFASNPRSWAMYQGLFRPR